jgi:2-polyprenyl-6-methoxyphenol hydroxylase-like FAD-dependent oxidoreductase
LTPALPHRYHNALLGWSDITAALAAALPHGSISTSCPITAYKQQQDGTIQLFTSSRSDTTNSSSDAATTTTSSSGVQQQQEQQQEQEQQQGQVVATCKALIGADGWFSAIRQQVLADGPPTFKDMVVFRARIKRPEGLPDQRTKWWVPPTGVTNSDMLAVLIPVPGEDQGAGADSRGPLMSLYRLFCSDKMSAGWLEYAESGVLFRCGVS